MREPPTTHITSGSLRSQLLGGLEYETGRIDLPWTLSHRQVQRVLTEQAEHGGWELMRLRRYRDGNRQAWMRRKVIKVRPTYLVEG
ncbi:MAG: DUF5703 family protein [Brooklawnia sp.]|jgi:urease accessory protein UreE